METNEMGVDLKPVKKLTKKQKHEGDRQLKRLNVSGNTKNKQKGYEEFKAQDISQEFIKDEEPTPDQELEEAERDGEIEFRHLMDSDRVARIKNGTTFSDGSQYDHESGILFPPLPDNIDELPLPPDVQGAGYTKADWEAIKREKNFRENQTGGGKRVGSQKVRGVR